MQGSDSGVWEAHVPGVAQGAVYKYHVVSRHGNFRVDKADPCAFRCELPPRTASLGSARTIAVHPASTTHRQLDEAALERAGIPQGLIRVSVGLEDAEDLLADFDHALTAARAALAPTSA